MGHGMMPVPPSLELVSSTSAPGTEDLSLHSMPPSIEIQTLPRECSVSGTDVATIDVNPESATMPPQVLLGPTGAHEGNKFDTLSFSET